MFVDETSVWKNPRTGLWERMFPSDFAPPGFRALSPTLEELQDWLLDPAISKALSKGSFSVDRDSFMGLELGRLDVLTSLRLVDFARAQEGRIYEMVSKVGLIEPAQIQALAPTANAMIGGLVDLMRTEPDALAEDIAREVAFTFYGAVSSFAGDVNPYVALAMQVIGIVTQAYSALRSARVGGADLVAARLPLHGMDARKRSDDARVSSLRLELSQSRDWTHLFMPPFSGKWVLRELGQPRPNRQGFGAGMAEDGDAGFTASGGWGFMPGTGRCLDLLQLEPNWYSLRDDQEDRRDAQGRRAPPSANWYSYYCDAVDEGCGQKPEDFAGTKDCRQCISIDAIRGSSRGDWREFSHSYVSEVINVGDWLSNSTQSLTALWTSFGVHNPATWCVDTVRLFKAWKAVWVDFFERFVPLAWDQRDAYPSRAVLSQFAAWGLVSREDGVLGGRGTLLDWRYQKWGSHLDEGITIGPKPPVPPVYSGCPFDTPDCVLGSDSLALRRIDATPFLLADSVWGRAIAPELTRVAQVQLAGYRSTVCAYLHYDQGAHADPETGELKKDRFGRAFEDGLRELLNTKRLRDAVHMGHVVDPKIRKMLLEAGASSMQTGAGIAAPETSSTDGKPPRAPLTPDDRPIVGFSSDWEPPLGAPALVGGYPLVAEPAAPVAPVQPRRRRDAGPLLLGGALLGGLGLGLARAGRRAR